MNKAPIPAFITIIALFFSAVVPAIIFTIALAVFTNTAIDSTTNQLTFGLDPIKHFVNQVAVWSYLCLCFLLPVSLIHSALLGVPAFIVGRNIRRINWLSVLTVSFFIGAIPWAFLIPLIITPNGTAWEKIQLAIVVGAAMGLLGSSGGMTFWVLWRYWILPMWPSNESSSPTQES